MTLSPSLTNHFIKLPFSIVGDNAGNPSFACLGNDVVDKIGCSGGGVGLDKGHAASVFGGY